LRRLASPRPTKVSPRPARGQSGGLVASYSRHGHTTVRIDRVNSLVCSYLGLRDYAEARLYQEALAKEVAAGVRPGLLLLLEHPAVFTVGRHASLSDEVCARLEASGVPLHRTGRGGGLTWHGPGQLVVYPVLPLRAAGRGVRAFVEALTRGVQAGLSAEGVESFCRTGAPGLFVGGETDKVRTDPQRGMRKIASIGLGVRRGVTLHGAAINLDARAKEGFLGLAPCGLTDVVATSVETERPGPPPQLEEFAHRLAPVLAEHLDFSEVTFVPAPGMES